MITIIITDVDGGETITAINQSADRALEAHGYDPNNVSYSVEKGIGERQDELEQRIEELESLL